MSDIQIQGFTALQQDLADRLWAMDSQHEVDQFVMALPKSLKREAWVVMQMIIAAELDQVMEVTDEVRDYLCCR